MLRFSSADGKGQRQRECDSSLVPRHVTGRSTVLTGQIYIISSMAPMFCIAACMRRMRLLWEEDATRQNNVELMYIECLDHLRT